MPPRATHFGALLVLLLLLAPACREPDPSTASDDSAAAPAAEQRSGPPGARWDVVDMLRDSIANPPGPADRGGRAWLESSEPAAGVQAGGVGRFTVVYEVGPLGVATDGVVFLQVSPFFDWSTPQTQYPEAPGFTTVEASAEDIELELETLNQQLLGIRVTGRPLVVGEQLRIVYGAGDAGAHTDTFAEKDSRFWIGVDGDGDGIRAYLPDSPGVDVGPGPAARLELTLPSTAEPGETVRLTAAVLDVMGNARPDFTGAIRFDDPPAGVALPASIDFESGDGAAHTVSIRADRPGVYRLSASGDGGLQGRSNPMVVSGSGPPILWGDLHGHSALSDGTGTVDAYFAYARNVAGLDFAALSDHDHWGILPLDSSPEMWDEIRGVVRRMNEPGRFVTLLAYEWTSWIYGHRHVVYFGDDGSVQSSMDPEVETPAQLWETLRGQSALTFAHHSAGGPIPTDWDFAPDPVLEPMTEIVSVHGSSEALDSPSPIYNPVRGNFVRDVLDRGYRLGFIGSGDSHDGHPGLSHVSSRRGGLAAIIGAEPTREGVLAALRARRAYATSGPRIVLRVVLGGYGMGMTVPVPEDGAVSELLTVAIHATAPLERVDLIRSGAVVDSIDAEGLLDAELARPVEDLRAGEYLYVRAVQEDGHAAWSSPFFFE